ncbi:MAG: enoyl-CoA hydratase/isomerase family protein [Pirellulaceae bacterium]|nr:enoyl-CoA hydratase/isomerase family protein [Pirellulaceae bacterium]
MIDVKVAGQVGTIVLQRPERCNALDSQMLGRLAQALGDLHQERRVRGIVLAGAGAHFCAGMDLKHWHMQLNQNDAMQYWMADAQALQALILQMMQLPKPIVAAVDGVAIGSGLALVLASDLVVASHRATFSAATSKRGLVSGLVAPLAAFRGGASLAANLLIGGAQLTASDAKVHGLVHHVVDAEMIWVRAVHWIEKIAEGAAESTLMTKRVLNEMVGEQLACQLASGAAALATSLTTEAAAEGLAAFVDKRPAQFPS